MDFTRTPQPSLSSELKNIITVRNILTTRTRMKVLQDLDQIQQESSAQKQQNLRNQAVHEILTSEVTYLSQLELIMEYFMKPIREKQLLSPIIYATLFENVQTLYNVNGELLKELNEDMENVASAFFKLAPFFKLYSVYAYNYQRALLALQEIEDENPLAAEFIRNQESRPKVARKLSSLLITPIQRVPRYKLLLTEVLRYTCPKRSDYRSLQASLVEIEKVAEHINDLVAEYENAQKILELQKRVTSSINLVKPGRKFIRQGPLMRVSRKGNSSFRRHFILLSDSLLYCKGDPEVSLSVCCLLPLNKCKIERILSNGLFQVICKQETLLLYSENGDSESWINDLQDAVKKYVECRQTLRKESSSRVPLRHVNKFSSANGFDVRLRKRRKGTRDLQTDSKIIYVNRDSETDFNADFIHLPKVQKMKFSEDTTDSRLRTWIKNFKFSKPNVVSTESPNKNVKTVLEKNSELDQIELIAEDKENHTNNHDRSSFSLLSSISKCFSFVKSSCGEIFKWRH